MQLAAKRKEKLHVERIGDSRAPNCSANQQKEMGRK